MKSRSFDILTRRTYERRFTRVAFLIVALAAVASGARAQERRFPEREAMYRRYLEFPSYVKGGSVEPRWMADGNSFWYAEGDSVNTVIWKVDPVANTRTPLFDVTRLRAALAATLGHEPPHRGVPFRDFVFRNGETEVEFDVEGRAFLLVLADYALSPIPQRRASPEGGAILSPDGRWAATIRDQNLWLTSLADGGARQITNDGVEGSAYYGLGGATWSPDGSRLVLTRADLRQMVLNEPVILRWLQDRPEVRWHLDWAEPGPRAMVDIIVATPAGDARPIRLPQLSDSPYAAGQMVPMLGWHPDGSTLFFLRTDALYQRQIHLMAADTRTGEARVVLTENGPLSSHHLYAVWESWMPNPMRILADGRTFIWMSERDGWNHLYLYTTDGAPIRRLTGGEFPVVRLVAVDEEDGWVYFTARVDARRPYDSHLCRVRLNGTGFQRLTPLPGEHDVPRLPPWLQSGNQPLRISPSKRFFVATRSTPATPPVTELRRTDGSLVRVLSEARFDTGSSLAWAPPVEFVVKADDGQTDLYGVLYRPFDFDPRKRYPVVEVIYAGPQRSIVPTTFASNSWGIWAQALAQLGFVTFVVEGRGTGERGRAFQHAIYGRVGSIEHADHVAAVRQLAAVHPYMDLDRVGITGDSYGGYHAVRAMLLSPDIYRVGVTSAPMATFPGPTFLGPREENAEGHAYASNLALADRLQGKLLLIHGTADLSVPLSVTLHFIEALIRANKPYDLMLMPDRNHFTLSSGSSDNYRRERVRRYLQEHLKP